MELLFAQGQIEQEESVWAFDLDLQCNFTANFVRPLPTTTLVDFFYEKVSLREVAVQVRRNFWVFPSGLKMNGAAAYVRSQDGGVHRLFHQRWRLPRGLWPVKGPPDEC